MAIARAALGPFSFGICLLVWSFQGLVRAASSVAMPQNASDPCAWFAMPLDPVLTPWVSIGRILCRVGEGSPAWSGKSQCAINLISIGFAVPPVCYGMPWAGFDRIPCWVSIWDAPPCGPFKATRTAFSVAMPLSHRIRAPLRGHFKAVHVARSVATPPVHRFRVRGLLFRSILSEHPR